MKNSAFLCCLAVLLLCELIKAKRPPKSGTRVNRIKGPAEREFSIDDATLTLEIEHSIGGGKEFHPRSKFTDLLSDPGDGSSGGGKSSEYVSTLISACALVKAQLSDLIIINGDGQGNIIGLTLTTPMTITETDCKEIDEDLLPTHFNTSVTIDNGLVGPVPDTEGYCRKVEEEEREKKEEKSKPSFLQKYWIYIVFAFSLLMFFNPPVTAEGGGGLGGAGGGQQ